MTVPIKKNYEQVFREAIPSAFGMLVASFGFSIRRDSDWQFEFKSEKCLIEIHMDRTQVFVDIKPVRISQVQNPNLFCSFDLGEIINCLNSKANFRYNLAREPEQIRDESERLSKLLLQHCLPILEGDFSLWSKLKAFREKQWDDFK